MILFAPRRPKMNDFRNIAVTCPTRLDALMLQYLALCCHLANEPLQVRVSPQCERSVDLRWPADLDETSEIQKARPGISKSDIKRFDGEVDWPPTEPLRVLVLAELKHLSSS